jgi:hypothetical protein
MKAAEAAFVFAADAPLNLVYRDQLFPRRAYGFRW